MSERRESEYRKYLAESYKAMDAQTLTGMLEYNQYLLEKFGEVADSGSVLVWRMKEELISSELKSRNLKGQY
jgi:hypothetical protein